MTKNLFDNENAIYMGAKRSPENCSIGIFGVNYDGTCSFKPGARFGPEAIRQVSSCLETYCPKIKKDLEDIMYVCLLYTSPSPRDRTRSRMPSSA
mgnify:CR=1 FL=1